MLWLIFIVILGVVFYKAKFIRDGFNEEYLSVATTNTIKGGCILLVFICHIYQYISVDINLMEIDKYFVISIRLLRQLMVAPFLFFSGYAVALKGFRGGYVKNFPRNRIFITLVNFDVAVVLYLVVALCLGNVVSIQKFVLSLIGWESIGNSNWYIFAILCCYAFSYVSLRVTNDRIFSATIVSVLCLGYWFAMIYVEKGSWWYDTILCYAAGHCFFLVKDKVEKCFRRFYFLFIVSFVGLFFLFYFLRLPYAASDNLAAVFFCLAIVLLCLKVRLQNKLSGWLGSHLFPIYIYQRLPMIILAYPLISGKSVLNVSPDLYFGLCLTITLAIAYFYPKWQIKIKQ